MIVDNNFEGGLSDNSVGQILDTLHLLRRLNGEPRQELFDCACFVNG